MKLKRVINAGICLVLIVALAFTSSSMVDAARSVSQITKDKNKLQKEIDAIDADLYAVVLQIEELSSQIAVVEEEIIETQAALEECTIACDDQYASMKVRIQYMYETPNPSVFEMLMESSSISDFLNRVEYVNDVYIYDREKLDQFQAIKAEMEELEAALELEYEQLAAYKNEMQQQEAYLDTLLAAKKDQMKDLDKELKAAKEKARREAAARAAALAAQRAKSSTNSNFNVNGNLNPSQTTGINGGDVVAYAKQFVGNRYVWGGTSLTNGCDCSGFVQGVYKNFGITWSGRMTSATFRTVGQEVSYDYMQPGDIVCYPGHVGIYAGGGVIVEAQSASTGITYGRSVNCHTIITIRRVI